ncbi:MAG: outer membrane protein assembly factor BamA [Paludibacteraceae bacterium]|nr:outer membrane protein assembly factor BamA [Paludibacteraceae bacterium]
MKRLSLIILIFTAISLAELQSQELSETVIDSYELEDTLSNVIDSTTILTSDEIPDFDYNMPRTYQIEEITISGKNNYEDYVLIGYSGLKKGEKIEIPGDEITNVIRRFWKQGLFSNIKIEVLSIRGNKIWLNINLDQQPKISRINFMGVKKKEREDLEKGMDMTKGTQVTPYVIDKATKYITRYFNDKGYYNAKVSVVPREDDASGLNNIVDVRVEKGSKVKVNHIEFDGNKQLKDKKLDKAMKKTNDRRNILNLFRSKKFIPSEYENDKKLLIEKYNEYGFRDAVILKDSVYPDQKKPKKYVNVYIKIEEGKKYYFRNINWIGNTVYTTEYLKHVLNIKYGDVYNQKKLSQRLFEDEDCVSNLYLDNGYLFFNLQPVETNIVNDSVDLELRISEGRQATINRVNIEGSTYLYEHVVRRELRTKPGDLFCKSDIMRSMRELAASGHFSTEPGKMDIRTVPDPENGTVDLTYVLESKRNDQVELSAGWGQTGIVGTLRFKFSNFSLKNLFNFKMWKPLPQGDGQSLTLMAQTNGMYYQAYSLSFTEPWLGGKRPTSFNFNIYYSIQSGVNSYYNSAYNNYYYNYDTSNSWYSDSYDPDKYIKIFGVSASIGTRLKWPDDYFSLSGVISYQRYNLSKWDYFALSTGYSNNFNVGVVWERNSLDQPIYTTKGSDISLGVTLTPPYSAFDKNKDYSHLSTQDIYKWVEYYKIKFKAKFFVPLTKNNKLVLMGRAEFGFLGYYNYNKRSPFETFYVGGDGMSGYSTTYATETVALRGYSNGSLTPYINGYQAGNIYTKFTLELRYPLVLKDQTMVWALAFAEAGNCWAEYTDFNPIDVKRSLGVGLRVFMPMFGLLGVDWAYGFDKVNGTRSGSQFHFIIGQEF